METETITRPAGALAEYGYQLWAEMYFADEFSGPEIANIRIGADISTRIVLVGGRDWESLKALDIPQRRLYYWAQRSDDLTKRPAECQVYDEWGDEVVGWGWVKTRLPGQ